MAINTDAVQRLYVAYFNRPSDPIGQAYWESKLPATAATQAQLTTLAAGFSGSAEYAALYAGQSNAQIVNNLYLNLFGRAAEPAGLTSWASALTAGTQTFASIALQLTYSAQGTDATAIANKLAAANAFTAALDTTAEITGYSGTAAAASARTWLATVTDVAATLTAATVPATLNAAVSTATAAGTSSTGTTFTLTTGVDTITGTANNDTIIADNTMAAPKQLGAADQINGGSGTDTLKVYLAAGDTATGEPTTMTSIENVYINGGAITAYTAATGTTGLTIDSAVSLTNATYTLSGQAVTLTKALTASAATAMVTTLANAATTTAATVTLSGYTSSGTDTHTLAVTGAALTTLNLVSSGASNKVTSLTNASAALTTINVSGDQALTFTESLAGVKTINASTATGKITVDVSGVTKNIAFAFTGGSANDKVTVAAGQLATSALTSGAQFDFGAGTDTLVIKDTTPVYTTINAMLNLEKVQMGVTAGTIDMSLLTASQVAFSAVAAGTVSNASATDVITATGAMGTSLTVGGAVGNSTTTINIGDSGNGAAGFTIASLVTTGLQTIALASNGDGTVTNVITAMTNTENSSFTITGSNALTMALTAGATVTGSSVNAAALTGVLTVTGTNMVDTIIGGTKADFITGGLLGDTLTGGAGADTFILTTGLGGNLWVGSLATTASMDRITDFVAGTDKISIANGTTTVTGVTMTAVTVATAADVATLLTAIGTSVAASAGVAEQVGLITVSAGAMAGTYLLLNDTANAATATDTLINITGVSGTVTGADFVFV